MGLLDLAELGDRLDRVQRNLFRMEALPAYAVATDGDDFHRWAAGQTGPSMDRLRPWLDHLRTERAAGTNRYRVRLFSPELTDYERYACEWGYALTSEAGEDIRVLRTSEHDVPVDVVPDDFWAVDDSEILVMRYDRNGGFLGAEQVTDERSVQKFLHVRDTAWAAAEPFGQWWARHPELRRSASA